MLNPFPELLVLGLLAPTILRVVLGVFFIISGWQHLTRERREGTASQLRVLGGVPGTYFVWYLAAAEVIVGGMLIVGFLTQIAALVSIIIAAKLIMFRKRYPMIAVGDLGYYSLVIAIGASLLLSGAGVVALDIPL